MKSSLRYILLGLTFFFALQVTQAQSKRDQLEQKRQALRAQITKINKLLSENKAEKQSVITRANDLQRRISATEELIKTNNQAANLLTSEINTNQNKITTLRKELEKLKKDYAKMMRKSYKSRSKQSRLMFLFSSDSFLQAYKRLQYMKQYTDYRRQQGEEIKAHAQKLQELNKELDQQRQEKKKLLAANRATKQKLQADKKEQEALIATINAKGSSYRKKIQAKQDEIARIDAEIQRLIREAIARENEKKGSKRTTEFALTPEAKALAASFASNKGKLPWPLKSGEVTMRFGSHPSPLAHTVTVQSNGIRIVTNANEPVKAVFKGKVLKVQVIRGANKLVFLQHGNYITVYRNLSKIHVHTGDNVSTGQIIGEVGVARDTRRPTLYFYVLKDIHYLNPLKWILNQ